MAIEYTPTEELTILLALAYLKRADVTAHAAIEDITPFDDRPLNQQIRDEIHTIHRVGKEAAWEVDPDAGKTVESILELWSFTDLQPITTEELAKRTALAKLLT